jgi:3-dehydroquinate dehydratase
MYKIGEDTIYDSTTHPSILEIKNHVAVEKNFEFQHITSDKIEKIIDKKKLTFLAPPVQRSRK